jgi:ketosteroid isomerase-like protein
MSFVFVAGAVAFGSPASDVAAVHAADDAWVRAYNAGQLENVVALYDENAVIYPPGVPPVQGRAMAHTFFEKDMTEFAKTGLAFSLGANPDGGVSGAMGWSSGTWTVKDKDSKVLDSGWYFSVSRKVGGKWLYVRDSWNSNGPARPTATTEK